MACALHRVDSLRVLIVFLETWHQYDDTIYPGPTWLEKLPNVLKSVLFVKSMDSVEGRNIAIGAMLPHWEGVFVDDAGKEMTAVDTLQKVQNVAYCLTKRRTKQDGMVHTTDCYNFDKVRQYCILKFTAVLFWNLYYLCIFQFPDTGLLS